MGTGKQTVGKVSTDAVPENYGPFIFFFLQLCMIYRLILIMGWGSRPISYDKDGRGSEILGFFSEVVYFGLNARD